MTSFLAQSPWMQALGWTLLHFVWQGALVGVIFAALRALIPKGHSNARYANGLAALALMFVFPLVTLFAMLSAQAPIEPVAAVEAATAGVQASVGTAVEAGAQPAVLSLMDLALQWLVCLWVAGVLLMGYRSWYQWRSLVRIAREWAEPIPELEAALRGLARRFEFVRKIQVLVSDRVDTPILLGWFKPVILLPTAVALGFPRHQVELILAHELGHLRRYDHIVNLVQALVETLLFYHPVVHWISREIRNEREICCDTLVLHRTSGDPCEYARTLAALEELRQPPAQLALAANGGVLLERVRRILGSQRHSGRRSGRWPWLLAVSGTAIALLVAMRVELREPVQVPGVELAWERPSLEPLMVADRFVAAPLRPKLIVPELVVPVPSEPEPRQVAVSPRPEREVAPVEAPRIAPLVTTLPVPAPERVVAVAAEPAVAPPPVVQLVQAPEAAPEAPEPAVSAEPAPAPVAQAAREKTPTPRHMVSPEYPDSSSGHTERVRLEFAIASDGSVRDVRVVTRQPEAFSRAAERALKQWRFERGSFASGAKRYSQTFVFAPPQIDLEGAESGCVRRTGTKLCRRSIDPAEPGADLFHNPSQVAQVPSATSHGS